MNNVSRLDSPESRAARARPEHEAIIVGAGICGIYQLYRLVELGVDVTVLEAGTGPGGTWYWNRYPGARFDSESYSYGYSFSQELLDEWDWSEHFAAQPETLQYLNYVVDKFDLRGYMQFGCEVTRCTYDDDARLWTVELKHGRKLTCRFLLTAIGILSAPTLPRYEGMEKFKGKSFHTFHWPEDPVVLEGKRVGVIGTGSTGVQIITEIASLVGELKVFQRHPNWCTPLHNSPISPEEMADIRSRYDEIFALCQRTPGGYVHGPLRQRLFDVPEEQRHAFWERQYASPGFSLWYGNYIDITFDEKANAEFSGWMANKIRERIHDPVVAEKMVPTDHGFGTRRVVLENQYYEVYNRSNVELIDLEATPIECVTETGIRTSDGDIDLDVIVYATGFDAVTGAFDRIDFVGVDGLQLRDKWAENPDTYLGLQTHGFPNLLTLTGPTGASVSANVPRGIEDVVNFATELLVHIRGRGMTRVEATEEAEADWVRHVREVSEGLLVTKTKSWFTGHNTNVDGRQHNRYLMYNGGAPRLRKRLAEVKERGYEGFVLR